MSNTYGEYEKTYGTEAYGGYLFHYNKGNVSSSRYLEGNEVKKIPRNCICVEKLAVICKPCDSYMVYEENGNGYFVCESCGKRVNKSTLFHKLEREAEKEEAKFNDYDDLY